MLCPLPARALVYRPPSVFRVTATTHAMAWEGRALGMLETEISHDLNDRVTIGGSVTTASGHGHSRSNRYEANGLSVWGQWRALPSSEERPDVDLRVEQEWDAISLNSSDATSSLQADPTCSTTGVQVRVTSSGWQARTTLHTVQVNKQHVAEVASIGGEINLPISTYLTLVPSAAIAADNYQGGHTTCEAGLGLNATLGDRTHLMLGANYFPSGVPLAGTPLSTASAVGAIYGSSASAQFRTEAVGYLSARLEYEF
jgi:hypothetical protein